MLLFTIHLSVEVLIIQKLANLAFQAIRQKLSSAT